MHRIQRFYKYCASRHADDKTNAPIRKASSQNIASSFSCFHIREHSIIIIIRVLDLEPYVKRLSRNSALLCFHHHCPLCLSTVSSTSAAIHCVSVLDSSRDPALAGVAVKLDLLDSAWTLSSRTNSGETVLRPVKKAKRGLSPSSNSAGMDCEIIQKFPHLKSV